MQIVTQAISRSISRSEIAHIRVGGGNSPAAVEAARAELARECEGSVTHAPQDGVLVHEFWGRNVDGEEWRVHVHCELAACNARYVIYAASIEHDGLRLSKEPRAVTDCATEALRLAGDPSNHGPEGAAIVCWDGRIIYTADEYDRFRAEEAAS